jgi:hypothetical protein
MTAPYAWHCFVCSEVNPPTRSICVACGFPARATGTEIAAAKAARALKVQPQRPAVRDEHTLELVRSALSPLPFWRQCLVVLGAIVSTAGVIWFKVAFSVSEAALSAAAVAIGLGLLGFGLSGPESSASGRAARHGADG